MKGLKRAPAHGLFGATLGFFIGFVAVAFFGPPTWAPTAWFPTYRRSYFGVSASTARLLTSAVSILTSLVRIVGGVLSDELEQGGENTATLALLILLAGSLVMAGWQQIELAAPGGFLVCWAPR